MCVPVRGHRGELGDRRSRRVDLEASRDAAGPERLPGSREAVRRASSRSDNSLTEQSASDRSPAHAGPSTARGRPRSEASFEKVIRTSTLSTTAASHRTQRGGRESNSSWRRRDPPKTSQLELVTAGRLDQRRLPRRRARFCPASFAQAAILTLISPSHPLAYRLSPHSRYSTHHFARARAGVVGSSLGATAFWARQGAAPKSPWESN